MRYFRPKALKLLLIIPALAFVGCNSNENFKAQLEETLKENPEVITNWIKENPSLFITTMQEALTDAQQDMKKQREEQEKEQLLATLDNPLEPQIREDETFRGPSDAAITLVEYSDFECPYCTRGFQTVMELQKKYGDDLRFVYKHLPLSFHPNARIASQYYEAIRLQDEEKAFEFHDEIFKQQKKLSSNGEGFLKNIAKKVGANMDQLAKDVNSEKVNKRIDEDIAEAKKFGIQGTPGFVINGVPVKGAYPASHFIDIVKELEERGKLSL
jgi:protein-disulfide isomerase